jgi:hypothetical protein
MVKKMKSFNDYIKENLGSGGPKDIMQDSLSHIRSLGSNLMQLQKMNIDIPQEAMSKLRELAEYLSEQMKFVKSVHPF